MKPTIKYGFRVLTMCQCRITDSDTRTTLVGDADSGEGFKYVGAEGIQALSVLAT